MSVPESKRAQCKLEATVKASGLAAYTGHICKNQKVFLPEYNNLYAERLCMISSEIYLFARRANRIRVTCTDEYRERIGLQDKAISRCDDLLDMIGIVRGVYHLSGKRVRYWSQFAIDTRTILRAWRDNDKKRFSEFK